MKIVGIICGILWICVAVAPFLPEEAGVCWSIGDYMGMFAIIPALISTTALIVMAIINYARRK